MNRWERGVVWMVALFGAFAFVRYSVWLLPAAIVIYIAGAIDAFVATYRAPEESGVNALGVVVVIVANIVMAFVLRAFVVEAFKIPSSAMYPTLHIGDHIFIRKTKSVERADVVVFKYPCMTDRDYIKRVVAKAGDTVEVRCGTVYVNAKPAPVQLVTAQEAYSDFDESAGQSFKRDVSRYRETLDGRTHEIYQPVGGAEALAIRDFPSAGEAPRCMEGGAEDRGKIVVTKPDATPCELQRHYVVPADHVFVMGDHRANSNDSRIWGSVPVSYLKGTVIGIWLSTGPENGTFSRFGDVH